MGADPNALIVKLIVVNQRSHTTVTKQVIGTITVTVEVPDEVAFSQVVTHLRNTPVILPEDIDSSAVALLAEEIKRKDREISQLRMDLAKMVASKHATYVPPKV